MLVLTRKRMEKLYIGGDICVTVVRLEGSQVRLGIDAPRDVSVVRAELKERDRVALRGGVEGDGVVPEATTEDDPAPNRPLRLRNPLADAAQA